MGAVKERFIWNKISIALHHPSAICIRELKIQGLISKHGGHHSKVISIHWKGDTPGSPQATLAVKTGDFKRLHGEAYCALLRRAVIIT